jgi:hypothetical protein
VTVLCCSITWPTARLVQHQKGCLILMLTVPLPPDCQSDMYVSITWALLSYRQSELFFPQQLLSLAAAS